MRFVNKTIKITEDLEIFMENFAEKYRKQSYVSCYGCSGFLEKEAVECGLLTYSSKDQELSPTCLARMLYSFKKEYK